jgi:hypothetical protein
MTPRVTFGSGVSEIPCESMWRCCNARQGYDLGMEHQVVLDQTRRWR